ncbi:MAG: alpha/beta fold hydrolase [Magnetococcales bacterium]|nr:alpha/beta fold hydrolase [Magnetococcales bacterium]MBF0322542.1 alpha/beta fold hydrolase [Magnetococcales bacterium]
MKLEILSALPTGHPRPYNLLFVHGMCVGAWVWSPHFLPCFAEWGYPAHALSLRGHGRSPGAERIGWYTLADYADDIETALRQLPGPTILVGHSLGGAVVQEYMRNSGHKVAGMVLMASVPPYGLTPAVWRMFFENPALWWELAVLMFAGARRVHQRTVREGLFSPGFPDQDFRHFVQEAGNESWVVGMELMGWRPFAPLPNSLPNVLVLGAANDRFVPVSEVKLTASWYGTEAIILPNTAHAIMLEPRWQQAAQAMLTWLEKLEKGLPSPATPPA